jgi:hypothetical protein
MDFQGNIKLLSLTAKLSVKYDDLRAQIALNAAQAGEVPEEEVYFKLTPAQLMNYAEGKDQYTIVDLSDKIYVAPEDAENYISATNLMQFLSSYGIVDYDQLQKSYDALFSNAAGAEGTALKLVRLQDEKPAPDDSNYWAEPNSTPQQKVYASMIERVTATLDNVSSTVCSCIFNCIADMLSYADATSITDAEIYEKFYEVTGIRAEEIPEPAPVNAADTAPAPPQQAQAPTVINEPSEMLQAAAVEEVPLQETFSQELQAETPALLPEEIAAEEIVEETPVAAVASIQESILDNEQTPIQVIYENNPAPQNIRITNTENKRVTGFTTSTGEILHIPVRRIVFEEILEDDVSASIDTKTRAHNFALSDAALQADKTQINSKIANLRTAMYAASRLERLHPDMPLEVGMYDLSNLSTAAARLFSNYIIDENGNYVLGANGQQQLKSLRQKIVDTYAIATNYTALDIPPGEVKDNPGDIKNKETDMTVRGALKSAEKDIQKAFGAEEFDLDRYLADYAAWADNYAELSAAYDADFENLQKLQEPEDSGKAQWYTNLWAAMGGENIKLGEDVQMNVVKNNVGHGHARGDYSNELRREFVIPEKSNYKQSDQFIVLDEDKMNDEVWLKQTLKSGNVRLEKYVDKKSEPFVELHHTDTHSVSQKRPVGNHHSDYSITKKLLQDENSFESFM